MRRAVFAVALTLALTLAGCAGEIGDTGGTAEPPPGMAQMRIEGFTVPDGAGPHDVAPAAGGGVWFTAQHAGYLGHLDPETGEVEKVPLGAGSRPHGVITGPDDHAWVTDGGLNAIVRVDRETRRVRRFPLPGDRDGADLNTAAFDTRGRLWFTGQNGVYGRLDTASGEMDVFDAPLGRGPYGITATRDGPVYYASLAGNHIARVDPESGRAEVLKPPTGGQGARRVWADGDDRIWVSEYNSGRLARYEPGRDDWKEWPLPRDGQATADPAAYAVYVDDTGTVWLSDTGGERLLRFDPAAERFTGTAGDAPSVRQIHGRPGEVWSAASGEDRLLLIRT